MMNVLPIFAIVAAASKRIAFAKIRKPGLALGIQACAPNMASVKS